MCTGASAFMSTFAVRLRDAMHRQCTITGESDRTKHDESSSTVRYRFQENSHNSIFCAPVVAVLLLLGWVAQLVQADNLLDVGKLKQHTIR